MHVQKYTHTMLYKYTPYKYMHTFTHKVRDGYTQRTCVQRVLSSSVSHCPQLQAAEHCQEADEWL